MPDTATSSQLTLTKTRIHAGVWEGMLMAEATGTVQPQIEVLHLDTALPGVELKADGEMQNLWQLRVPIPAELLSEGVQTFTIRDARTGATLEHFTIVTGQPLEDDIRAEVDLLRAELDMLKKAFRRHCLEVLGR
ncbi:hypothetical protein FHY55_18940 [Oceanicola sp. D3]|uniref:hypothetical protein n=1 Tax=Oceanicola sp. D3 TaxID=2587163 RepID=UPI00111DAE1B|nr:hypothetical protein [Oceanicola sp. D3]QDC11180.1 hypothetical protein FHY55_18940 [Oceanicola sp. D3]